jgi:peptidyl-prolyl cis-trans isomerase A (cyclophilin A)
MRRVCALSFCALLLLLPMACGDAPPADSPLPESDAEPSVEAPPATEAEPAEEAAPAEEAPGADVEEPGDPLLDPESPAANRQAPATYRVRFRTTAGEFVIEVQRAWAPRGADRFYNLVNAGFFDDTRFFRVVDGFVVQFGLHGDPAVNAAWSWAEIRDDPVEQMNTRGRITFATGGPDTRTTQVFINLGDNLNLDGMGFAPFGEVVEGMDIVRALYAGYGDGAPYGAGPDQGRIQSEGNAYLDADFPELDQILQARIVGQ